MHQRGKHAASSRTIIANCWGFLPPFSTKQYNNDPLAEMPLVELAAQVRKLSPDVENGSVELFLAIYEEEKGKRIGGADIHKMTFSTWTICLQRTKQSERPKKG